MAPLISRTSRPGDRHTERRLVANLGVSFRLVVVEPTGAAGGCPQGAKRALRRGFVGGSLVRWQAPDGCDAL